MPKHKDDEKESQTPTSDEEADNEAGGYDTQIIDDDFDIDLYRASLSVKMSEKGFLEVEALEKKQWEWAKAKQREIIRQTGIQEFKLQRTDPTFRAQAQALGIGNNFFNSFISVKEHEDAEPTLYEMSAKGHVLDKGRFGKVKCGQDEQGNIFAIKVITQVKKASAQTKKTDDELNEIAIEKKLGISKGGFTRASQTTKNTQGEIINLAPGATVEKEYQVKEFLGKSLKSILADIEAGNRPDYTPDQKKEIATQLLEALDHLHAIGIIHRDIHEGNILINTTNDGKLSVRLIDFGLSSVLKPGEDKVYHQLGRPYNYLLFAPELEAHFKSPSPDKPKRLSTEAYFDKATDRFAAGLFIQRRLGFDMSDSLMNHSPAQRTTAAALAAINRLSSQDAQMQFRLRPNKPG